jgi:hypothetical protein
MPDCAFVLIVFAVDARIVIVISPESALLVILRGLFKRYLAFVN